MNGATDEKATSVRKKRRDGARARLASNIHRLPYAIGLFVLGGRVSSVSCRLIDVLKLRVHRFKGQGYSFDLTW